MTTYTNQNKIHRSDDGIVFGVCQGLAEWRDLPVFYIRLTMILLLVFTGFFPIALLYLAAGLLLPKGDGTRSRESASFNEDFEREKRREESRQQYNADRESDWDQKFYDR